jgi:hypothetical protein
MPTNTADWRHLLALQCALAEGVCARVDSKRPEFFEIETGDNRYYIHIPSRIGGVFLIAAAAVPNETAAIHAETMRA